MNKTQESIASKNRKKLIQELKEGMDKLIENIIYSGELDEKSIIPAGGKWSDMENTLDQINYEINTFNNQVYDLAKIAQGKTDTQMDVKKFLVL